MLTSSNLRVISSKSNGLDIHSFIASQARFSQIHATEGRRTREAWDHHAGESESGQQGQKAPIASAWTSGFDTPILKARTANTAGKDGPREKESKTQSKSRHNATNADDKTGTDTRRRKKAKTPPQATPPPKSKSKPAKGSPKDPPNKKKTSAKELKKRPAYDTDDEQTHHLAERRERKRARREIMKPPVTQAPSEDEEEEDENERTVVTKQAKGKKKSKGKAPKIPAGLALMHGFSATNVGKNRLTLDPGTTSGVFGKGKASTKAATGQQSLFKNIRQHGFSEELFLRDTKKKASRRKDRRPILDDSDDSNDSSHSGSSSSTVPLAVRKKTPKHKSVKRTKGSPQPAKPSYAHNLKSPSTSPTPKRPSGPIPSYPENTESEVWDIELEGNALPSGSGVSVTSQDKVTRSPSGTVLSSPPPHQVLAMNTLLAPFRPEPHSDSNTVQLELRHPASHNGNARSYASLAPSESASQVHPRVPIKEPNLATRSRFFANVPKGPPKPDPTSVETKTVEEHLQHPLESLDQPASVVSRNNDAQHPVLSDLLPSHYSVTRSRHSSHRPHSAPMSDQHVPPAGCSSPSSLEQALADLTDPPGQESCLGTSFTYLLHDECNSGVGVMPTPRYRYHLPPSSHSPVLQSWEEHDLTAYDDDYGPQTPSPHGQDEVTEADIDASAHPNFYGYPTYSHEVDSINPAHPDDVLMADPLFDSYDDHSADYNANLTAPDDDLINDVRDYEEEEDIVFQGDFHSTQTTDSSHYVNDTIALDMSEDYLSGDDIGMEVQDGEAWGLQGRELLLGLGHRNDDRFDVARGQSTWSGGVWQAEEDVARRLKNHWLPQSF